MTPRQLLRLYPRQWRNRYGDEFLAVLEHTVIDRRVVRDVVRAAAGEWAFETLTGRYVIAVFVTAVASVAAQYVNANVPVLPSIEILSDGTKSVSPPWPTGIGVLLSSLQLIFFARSVIGFFPWRLTRMTRTELALWILIFGVVSIGSQWGQLVAWHGTGITPDSPLYVGGFHALMLGTVLALNFNASTFFNPRYENLGRPPEPRPPLRPLGLRDA